MSINCMNCGAMLIGGETVCPVCRQPVASAQANTSWQPAPPQYNQPQYQTPPPGAQWQQRPIGPPPLGGGQKSLNVIWMIGVVLALVVVLASAVGIIFFAKSRRTSITNDNENYNRRARVDPTPDDYESVPPSSSPTGRTTTNRNSPISGGVLNGKATSLPKPPYPALARAARASGTVIVQVTVDESGRVTEARAISGHPLLRAAAEQAARQARFSPTNLAGQPAKVKGVLSYNFTPDQQ